MVQDKELSSSKEKRNVRNLLAAGKLLVTVLIISYIYKNFQNEQKGIGDVSTVFANLFTTRHFPVLAFMLFLVPVNWALESLKWKQLASKVVNLTFKDAFRGTLTGLAVGVAAPAQLGDTIGRVAALKSDRRLEAIGAAIVSNGIQFYVSAAAGTAGWFYLHENLPLSPWSKQLLNTLLIAILVSGWIVVWLRKPLTNWNPKKTFSKKIHDYIHIIGHYTVSELLISLSYGILRYLVFISQFIMALLLFDFPVSVMELAACVSLIFLAKTLIPAINVLGDLGLREFTALIVFQQYQLPAEQIIAATFLVWIINVLGPILIGIFLIWKYRWKDAGNLKSSPNP